jgi:hypothetical protein
MPHVIVWDIETVPDLKGFAAADGHDGKTDEEIHAELGERFPKHMVSFNHVHRGSNCPLEQ